MEETLFEYNRLYLALLNQETDADLNGESHVEVTLAERRLEEDYCKKLAACEFLGSNQQRNPLIFSSSFSDCLDEDAKEKSDDEQ